jgi:hypothetical protein
MCKTITKNFDNYIVTGYDLQYIYDQLPGVFNTFNSFNFLNYLITSFNNIDDFNRHQQCNAIQPQ